MAMAMSQAFAQSLACFASAAANVASRVGSSAELGGDVLVACTGGTPTITGQPVPRVNIQLLANTTVTSRLLQVSPARTEALLFIDNPAPSQRQVCPDHLLSCGLTGVGTGIIYATPGHPSNAGQTVHNVYPSLLASANSLLWQGVTFDPPGLGTRILRFTNLRGLLPPGTGSLIFVISTSAALPIANPAQTVAQAMTPLGVTLLDAAGAAVLPGGFTLPQCADNNGSLAASPASLAYPQGRTMMVRLEELFPSVFRRRTTATPSPPTTGETAPPPVAQDILGSAYGTESGLYDPASPATGGLSTAGLAGSGTRLYLRFDVMPAGVRIFTAVRAAVMAGATQTGVARRIDTDGNGAGAFTPTAPTTALDGGLAPLADFGTHQMAVFEILHESAGGIDRVEIPVVVAYAEGGPAVPLRMRAGLGPVSDNNTAAGQVLPRFQLAPDFQAGQILPCPPSLPPPEILTPALPDGVTGVPYFVQLSGRGVGALRWRQSGGTLPPGLRVAETGAISGVPEREGQSELEIEMTDELGRTARRRYTLRVLPPVTIETPCPLPQTGIGAAFQQRFQAAGGRPPYVFQMFHGRLPRGLALSPDGTISGTASETGLFEFTVQALDSGQAIGRKSCSLLVGGPVQVELVELTLRGYSGGPPVRHPVGAAGDVPGQGIEVSAGGGAPWLSVDPAVGRSPMLFEVVGDPSRLTPGSYQAEVNAAGRRIPVRFLVGRAPLPQLVAEPAAVQAGAPHGAGQLSKGLTLFNRGASPVRYGGSLEFLTGQGWVRATPLNALIAAGSSLRVLFSFLPAGLAPGVYRAALQLDLETGAAAVEQLRVPVLLAVSNGDRLIELSQTGLAFQAGAGAQRLPPQSFQIRAAGGAFPWTAQTRVEPDLPQWLSLSRTAGDSSPDRPLETEVQVNAAGLAPGSYFGDVVVRAEGVDNSPRVVVVSLTVEPGTVLWEARPAGLLLTARTGQGLLPRQSVRVHNTGSAPLRIEAQLQGNGIWSLPGASSGNVAAGGSLELDILANAANLRAGTYRTALSLRAAGDLRVRVVDLALIVSDNAPRAASAQMERHADAVCPPGGLQVSLLRHAGGFSSPVQAPLPVEVRVTGNDGQPLRSGEVTASLTGTARISSLTADPLDAGRWSGTLFAGGALTPATLRVLAANENGTLTGCREASGTLTGALGPFISEGSVVSAASFLAGAPVAPGGIVAVFGSGLAESPAAAASLPLPFRLGLTRLTLSGPLLPAPLFFAGPSQVNAILPYGLTPNILHPLRVNLGTAQADAEVAVAETAPAVFVSGGGGSRQGAIVHGANLALLADAANPADRGSVVVIYCEGLGSVEPLIAAGAETPASPLRHVVAPVQVTIGGQAAQVQFAGLTPGSAGLYQINAVIPAGVVPGAVVPVVVQAGGQTSATVTMGVR